jgi:hypothetical protein
VEGVLAIPLWKGAKFWLAVFPDGTHAASIFRRIVVKKCCMSDWDMNPRNRLGTTQLSMLFMEFVSAGSQELTAKISADVCIKRVFGQDCHCG